MMEQLLNLLITNPKMAQELIKEQIEKYKPLTYTIGQEFLNIYKDYADNTEYFATVAKARKNSINAYCDAGFTRDEAMSLLLNDITKTKEMADSMSKSINKK